LAEIFIAYNNAIRSITQRTPQELFTGRTHIFFSNVTFNDEHGNLRKINAFQTELYLKIKERVEKIKTKRIELANRDRHEPMQLVLNETILRKENRRDKLPPRFSKHKLVEQHGLTITTTKPQKVHKEK